MSTTRKIGGLPRPGRTVGLWLLATILVILLGWALRAMAPVAVPVTFALFITLVVTPLDQRIANALPDRFAWLGRIAVMLLLVFILAVFIAGLAFAIQQFASQIPRMSEGLRDMLPQGMATEAAAGTENALTSTDAATDEAADAGGSDQSDDLPLPPALAKFTQSFGIAGNAFGGWIVDMASNFLTGAAASMGSFVAATVIVFFLVLLGLGETSLFRRKIDHLCAAPGREAWHDTISTTIQSLRQFLIVRAGIGVISAFLYVGWLALFGVDLLIAWGVLTFLLSFVPSIGSIISGVLAVFYALVTVGPMSGLGVAVGLFVIEQVIGNYLDPKLQGKRVALSPLMILVALLIFGWLWGAVGTLLAVPVTIAILNACNTIPALRPFALFLSSKPTHDKLDSALRN